MFVSERAAVPVFVFCYHGGIKENLSVKNLKIKRRLVVFSWCKELLRQHGHEVRWPIVCIDFSFLVSTHNVLAESNRHPLFERTRLMDHATWNANTHTFPIHMHLRFELLLSLGLFLHVNQHEFPILCSLADAVFLLLALFPHDHHTGFHLFW